MPKSTDFYINGQWVAPAKARDCPVIDPSTEEVCATISLGDRADTDAAVAAAKAAFEGWAATPVAERIAALERVLAAYNARAEDMAQAISREMGAHIDWARQQQVTAGSWHIEGFIAAAKEMEWDYPLGDHAPGERILHDAIGVAALITPWNWPMNQVSLKVAFAAADTIKRVSLELGGKGANIIFDDAEDKAIQRGATRCFNNSGQSCNAPTRMLVSRDRYEAAVEIAARVAEETPVIHATEEGRGTGPVVSEAQFEKIQGLIQTGIDEGARLVAGGTGRPGHLNRGFFVRPTVFADVTPDMTIYREEIFGPVLSIIPFDSEEDAVRIANDTVYGLTNYIQTADKDRLRRVARRLRSGMVECNGTGFGKGSPFGGFKQSGNGREGGVWGIHEFLEVKAVSDWG
jgi:acyl-CoA reductase-like NAD-dependent aldehyde dehydrogenase